jgi:hypothetical protein
MASRSRSSEVAAPGFAGTEPLVADVWISAASLADRRPAIRAARESRGSAFLVLGRLAPGASRAGAADAMSVVASRLAAAYPGSTRPAGVAVTPGTFFTLDPGDQAG